MTRYLIVDDHPLFQEALRGVLQIAAPESDCLQAATIEQAIGLLSSTETVDLMLLDLAMPGTTGFSGIVRLRKAFPRIPLIIVSAYQSPQIVSGAFALGVSGYIYKSASKTVMMQAVEKVLRGSIFLPHDCNAVTLAQQSEAPVQDLLKRLLKLTQQQLRVLEMLLHGLQNKHIAHELQISEATVKVHVTDILHKLNVSSRTQAIVEMSKVDFVTLASRGAAARQICARLEPPPSRFAANIRVGN